jgi:hypothetical protein
MGGCRTQ